MIQALSFCVWLISLSKMSPGVIHAVAYVSEVPLLLRLENIAFCLPTHPSLGPGAVGSSAIIGLELWGGCPCWDKTSAPLRDCGSPAGLRPCVLSASSSPFHCRLVQLMAFQLVVSLLDHTSHWASVPLRSTEKQAPRRGFSR